MKCVEDIKDLHEREEKVEDQVLEFLKKHRGKPYTEQELAGNLGIRRSDLWGVSNYTKGFLKGTGWKICSEITDSGIYYYAERDLVYLILNVLGWVVLGAIVFTILLRVYAAIFLGI